MSFNVGDMVAATKIYREDRHANLEIGMKGTVVETLGSILIVDFPELLVAGKHVPNYAMGEGQLDLIKSNTPVFVNTQMVEVPPEVNIHYNVLFNTFYIADVEDEVQLYFTHLDSVEYAYIKEEVHVTEVL